MCSAGPLPKSRSASLLHLGVVAIVSHAILGAAQIRWDRHSAAPIKDELERCLSVDTTDIQRRRHEMIILPGIFGMFWSHRPFNLS